MNTNFRGFGFNYLFMNELKAILGSKKECDQLIQGLQELILHVARHEPKKGLSDFEREELFLTLNLSTELLFKLKQISKKL